MSDRFRDDNPTRIALDCGNEIGFLNFQSVSVKASQLLGRVFFFRPYAFLRRGAGFGFIMAGKVKELIDRLIELRTKGDRGLVAPVKIKLIMKGVDPDLFDAASADNPMVIQRVITIAKEMGYEL